MRFLFIVLLIITSSFRFEDNFELSSPLELAGLSDGAELIGGLLNPISGQLILRKTDLIAKGAQNIHLSRFYIPPFIPTSLDPNDKHHFYTYLAKHYRGWRYIPHLFLSSFPHARGTQVHLVDPSGVTLDFLVNRQHQTELLSSIYGMSNVSNDFPSSKQDFRNTHIHVTSNQIDVLAPDGTTRIYQNAHAPNKHLFILRKEILPSGKVLHYRFKGNRLEAIVSQDPQEKHNYAELWFHPNEVAASSHSRTKYFVEQKEKLRIPIKRNKKTKEHDFYPPVLLKKASSPFYREETIEYNDRFLIDSYRGQNEAFHCTYAPFGEEAHFRVNTLSLPSGRDDAYHAIYSLQYEVAIPGKKEGWTEVKNSDGTKIIYHISKELLVTKIQYFGEEGTIRKEKLFEFDNQRLISLELRDGEGKSFYIKRFETTPFGDPKKEILVGNLTGESDNESYAIERLYSQDRFHRLVEEKHDNGLRFVFKHLAKTNLVTSKLTYDGDRVLVREFYFYDASHHLVKKIVDNGAATDANDLTGVTERRITEFTLRQESPFLHMTEWIEEKYLDKDQEHLLKRTQLIYNKAGNVSQENIYDASNQFAYSIHKTYNARGDLTSETNALGQKAIYGYESRGHRTQVKNFSNRLDIQMRYDLQGRLREKKEIGDNGAIHQTQFDYDLQDRLVEKKDPFGQSHRYAYDLISQEVTQTDFPAIASPEGPPVAVSTKATNDALGRKLSEIDANGNRTQYRYNAYGSPIEIIHPDGYVETFRYDKSGALKKQTTRDGKTIVYERDVLGRVTLKEIFSADQSVAKETFTYDSFHLLKETDKEGHLYEYHYDGSGRKIKESFEGKELAYEYDALGRVSKEIYHNCLVVDYKRDLLGQILEEKKSDLEGKLLYQIAYEYDADGNQTEIKRWVKEQEAVSHFTYDPFQRLVQIQDAEGHVTTIDYNENFTNTLGQRVLQKSTIDPLKIATLETSDALGNLAKKEKRNQENKILSTQEFFYDPQGNLVLQKDENHHLKYTYTPNHQVESFTRADARTTSFAYTPAGKIAKKTQPDGVDLLYQYDALNHLTALKASDGSLHHTFTHNKLGHLLKARDEGSQLETLREVDPFGNVTEETLSNGLILKRAYDSFDRPTTLHLPEGSLVQYSYDPLYLRQVQRGTFIHTYDTYDLGGNLIQEDTIRYERDLKGQITSITSPYFSEKYQYDSVSNLLKRTLEDHATNYAYDDLSQLISELGHTYLYDSLFNRIQKNGNEILNNNLLEISKKENTEYTFDLKGNCIQKTNPDTFYIYDALNRLTEVTTDLSKVHFEYDPLGRRISKVVYKKRGSRWLESDREHYLYDRDQEIGSFNNQGQIKTLKILSPTEDPQAVAIEIDERLFIPFHDAQGNVQRLFNPRTQQIEESYALTAFGEDTNSEWKNSWKNPWRYASKRHDPDTNLVNFGKRDYDRDLGRWLITDPAGFVDSVNLYQYVFNNPFRYRDPDGQFIFAIPLLTLGSHRHRSGCRLRLPRSKQTTRACKECCRTEVQLHCTADS